MSGAATLYTLLVVTYGANVSVNQHISSLEICRDAEQFARTGRSVAEEKAYRDEQERKAAERRAAEAARAKKWDTEHPPRAATEQDRKECFVERADGSSFGRASIAGARNCEVDKYGVVRDREPGPLFISLGITSMSGPTDIKFAGCFAEPETSR